MSKAKRKAYRTLKGGVGIKFKSARSESKYWDHVNAYCDDIRAGTV